MTDQSDRAIQVRASQQRSADVRREIDLKYGRAEISDRAAVTVASWHASSGTALAGFASGALVEEQDLLNDIARVRVKCTANESTADARALDMLTSYVRNTSVASRVPTAGGRPLLLVFLVIALIFGLAWVSSRLAPEPTSTGSVGGGSALDVRTATCSEVMALPQVADVEKRTLRTMADNEGLTVTTQMQNAFIAEVNSLCGRNPSTVYAVAASSAYVDVTGGP
ncbi:hypothetical protein ACQPYH_06185 [Kribbella sp. CA-245084]|uniref:hypothetical protein n=1 Tax=Kribbella sp. CA-245084 TaxID=3239940 RepID=UPI003D92E638